MKSTPEETANDFIDEELKPFLEQLSSYQSMNMAIQSFDYCKGVLLGIYRHEHESSNEFKDWCEGLPVEHAGCLLRDWQKSESGSRSHKEMNTFIKTDCEKWVKYLIKSKL